MTTADRARALTASKSTEVLIISLQALCLKVEDAAKLAEKTKDYADVQALNLVRSWTINALEERYPAAADEVGAAFDAAAEDEFPDYDALLISAVRKIHNAEGK